MASELTGDLPCAGCGYNLKSMSIRGVCPECGTPVRATILARIDPYAGVLRPISYPVLTAAGVIVWSMFALLAALLAWCLRGADAWGVMMDVRIPPQRSAAAAGTVCIVLSAAGALTLVRPHAGIALSRRLRSALAVVLVLAYAAVYWRIHGVFDPVHTKPYLNDNVLHPERNLLRIANSVLLAGAVLLLRPNVRLLAARSLVMRMGRVDRQTLAIIALVAAITVVGDLLHLAADRTYGDLRALLYTAGLFLIAVGSMLLTIGLVGVLVDSLRLVPVILRPPISMAQVVGEKAGGPGERP